MPGQLTHRPLRAPRKSGETLITPPLSDLPRLFKSNLHSIRSADCDLHGYPLLELRRDARSELIPLAVDYTRSYRDIQISVEPPDNAPLIVSGHQPQLFHPGVWFKNFALAACWHLPAITLNLIIDNDICLRPSIRVPSGSVEKPRAEVILYDSNLTGVPFEERSVRDKLVFNSFGQRVTDAIRPLVARPVVKDLWPLANQRLRETDNLGLCLSQARHQLEEQWRLSTLELPLSKVCQTNAFRFFVIHLLGACERLRTDYNSSLAEYRRVNRIRSRSHPVPELITEGGFFETPFWVWTTATPLRRRLFARLKGGDLYLTDRGDFLEKIERGPKDPSASVVRLCELEEKRGIKIRPRALTTTMFARLVLSDVFFHGIGGAKYDQLTDEIMRRFFGLEPPGFVTMTATAHLPLALPTITAKDAHAAAQRLRDAEYHPEKFIENGQTSAEVASLLKAKRFWIDQSPPRGQRAARHREIVRINTALRSVITERRAELDRIHTELLETLRRKSILASREFSFCLYPRETFEGLPLALS